ncbi:hypothetical protein [Cellulosilyticum sp. I15G10I2]|uniref:hypothetical protein n=1 Tax=Cellulosilyticum sp. I15G10I2 TaxID=1892843 RepID=UPI00085C43A8|nr:hypothetical protein [Cellulosilyticum sp. I15G10I2]
MSIIKQYWKRILLLTTLTILIVLGRYFIYAWQRVQKENNIVLLKINDEQEIYILGTIHSAHYQKNYNYSLADIKYAIDTIKPDLLLIETRQEIFDSFKALDGPSEMIFSWCYANENNIPVKGIDWWCSAPNMRANNSFNTAYDRLRDDEIYKNIQALLPDRGKVLIICGMTHRVAQTKRFICEGYNKIKLIDFWESCSVVSAELFHYPKTMKETYRSKINYLKTDFIDEIERNQDLSQNEIDYWLELSKSMAESSEHFLNEILSKEKLYK